MRVNIYICLFAFVLSCNVTSAIIHKTLEEKNSVSLHCPHSVEGRVTWSRERHGTKVDILTADGGREIRHNDPGRRYSSSADKYKSLYIGRVTISDTGRYLCNNEPAVELTVIPSGTTRLDAAERTTITLKCPPDVGGSDVPTWSRDTVEIQQQRRFHVSPADNTLIITDLQPADSGLYYCDGKPAAYLNVTSERDSETPTSTTTSTTEGTTVLQSPPKDQRTLLRLVIKIIVPSLFLFIIINIIICFRQRCRFKRQGRKVGERGDDTQQGATGQTQTHGRYSRDSASVLVVPALPGTEETGAVYDYIQDESVLQSINGEESLPGSIDSFSMSDYSDESNHNDPMYSTIPDLPPVQMKTGHQH